MPYAMKTVGQQLNQNAGRFDFDFSDSGQQIAAYLVGVTHMSLGFPEYTRKKIERIALSNVNFLEGGIGGATISVSCWMQACQAGGWASSVEMS